MRKQITTILVFLISLQLVYGLDLEFYPSYFFENYEFEAKIVVGEEAPPTDVASTVNMLPGLQKFASDRIRGSMLDSDVTDYLFESSNIISVGTNCDNEITEQIMDNRDCSIFKSGEAYIYLYESDLGNARLVVAGGTPEDTAKATIVLGNYEIYNLTGQAVKITGNSLPYDVVEIPLPGTELDDWNYVAPVDEEEEETEEIEEFQPDLEIPEIDDSENPAEKLQEEIDKELAEIEAKRAAEEAAKAEEERKKKEKDEASIDKSAPVYVQVWQRIKIWASWFFQ